MQIKNSRGNGRTLNKRINIFVYRELKMMYNIPMIKINFISGFYHILLTNYRKKAMSAMYISLSQHLEKVIKQGRSVPIQKLVGGRYIWVQSNKDSDRKTAISRMQTNLSHMR